MSEVDPFLHQHPAAEQAVEKVGLSAEQAMQVLDDTLQRGFVEVTTSFHDPHVGVEQGDSALRHMIDSNARESFETAEDKLKRAAVYATYQGGTRSPTLQHDQPFSDMIHENGGISDQTRRFIDGVTNNKAMFLNGLQQNPSSEDRASLAQGMRNNLNLIDKKLQDPDATDTDRGALALTKIFVAAASTEALSNQDIRYIIDKEVVPELTRQ